MVETLGWPAVVSAVMLALIAGLPGMIAAWKTHTIGNVVTARSDSQDHQLTKIEQATNGGVQALRDTVQTLRNKAIVDMERIDQLEALLKAALERHERNS